MTITPKEWEPRTSALSRYIKRHAADELRRQPSAQEALARLPDNVVELIHAALFGDRKPPGPDKYGARLRAQVRHSTPALASLSDFELDLAFHVTMRMELASMSTDWPFILALYVDHLVPARRADGQHTQRNIQPDVVRQPEFAEQLYKLEQRVRALENGKPRG